MDIENDKGTFSKNNTEFETSNLSEDLEFWMTYLPSKLRSFPIIELSIPGSHNSMTYTIERNNDIGPDEPVPIRTMGRYFSLLAKPVIFNWSINQEEVITDQLNGGIRYLDLRVASKTGDTNIYFLHGLYGAQIGEPLQSVADWLGAHPGEAIIVDFQHFYKFTEAHHRSLIEQVKYLFRGKMCPVHRSFDHISLQWLHTHRYQVFVIYRNIVAQNYNDLWPSGLWPTPWPNTVDPEKLVNTLDEGLRERPRNAGFVSQCLLTPDTPFILKHICGSLRRDLCGICRKVTLSWIESHPSGVGGMNIVITDYISLNNFQFSRTVIQRNATLLT